MISGEMINKMKILNLFAGIGGNRTLWGNEHEITAIENDQQVAMIYLKRFPNDIVIVGDAYQYFINNFEKFDFVWASPPCQSHSWNTYGLVGYAYKGNRRKIQFPDLRLYSLIMFLKHQFRGLWVIENVVPYYEPLIKPTTRRGRHYYWSNIPLKNSSKRGDSFGNMGTYESKEIVMKIAKERGIELSLLSSLDEYKLNQTLRNMILPEEGKHILDSINTKTLEEFILMEGKTK